MGPQRVANGSPCQLLFRETHIRSRRAAPHPLLPKYLECSQHEVGRWGQGRGHQPASSLQAICPCGGRPILAPGSFVYSCVTHAIPRGGPEAAWQGHRPVQAPDGVFWWLRHRKKANSGSEQSGQLLQFSQHPRLRQSFLRRQLGPSNAKHPFDHIFSRIWAFPLLLIHIKNHRPKA